MNEKIKLLIVYPEMMIGGSTTSLLGLLNELDEDRYDVDLALYVHTLSCNHIVLLPYVFIIHFRTFILYLILLDVNTLNHSSYSTIFQISQYSNT